MSLDQLIKKTIFLIGLGSSLLLSGCSKPEDTEFDNSSTPLMESASQETNTWKELGNPNSDHTVYIVPTNPYKNETLQDVSHLNQLMEEDKFDGLIIQGIPADEKDLLSFLTNAPPLSVEEKKYAEERTVNVLSLLDPKLVNAQGVHFYGVADPGEEAQTDEVLAKIEAKRFIGRYRLLKSATETAQKHHDPSVGAYPQQFTQKELISQLGKIEEDIIKKYGITPKEIDEALDSAYHGIHMQICDITRQAVLSAKEKFVGDRYAKIADFFIANDGRTNFGILCSESSVSHITPHLSHYRILIAPQPLISDPGIRINVPTQQAYMDIQWKKLVGFNNEFMNYVQPLEHLRNVPLAAPNTNSVPK